MKLFLYSALCIPPAAAGVYSHTHARLVNTTVHSTHPQVRYTPESCCDKDILGKCMNQYDPFIMSTYVDRNSRKRTVFQTNSRGNERQNPSMTRTVEVRFFGREAYLYGPPRGQLNHLPGELKVYVDGWHVTNIDLETNYESESTDSRNPHFIYHWKGGGADGHHVLKLSLWDDADGVWPWFPIRAFGFDSLIVTSRDGQEPSSDHHHQERKTLESVTIHDTDLQASYSPSNLWKRKESPIESSGGFRTFHETSDLSPKRAERTPVLEFTVQCSALAVYGAPPVNFVSKVESKYRHGHIQLCLGGDCDFIDTHQAYLNVPDKLSNEPVLLYSTDRMSPEPPALVSISLLGPESAMGYVRTTTFSHAVCWKVRPEKNWEHPMPEGSYNTHVIQHRSLQLGPSPSLWKSIDQYSFATVKPYELSEGAVEIPSWSATLTGHDIKIYVPVLPVSYADVLCCIDGECHSPDITQWSRRAKNPALDSPLVHYQDLNPFQKHNVSMTALPRHGGSGDAIMAVSSIVYEQVTLEPRPSPTPSFSEPVEEPTSSPETKPSGEPVVDRHEFQAVFNTDLMTVATIIILGVAHYLFSNFELERPQQQIQEVQDPDHRDHTIVPPTSSSGQMTSSLQNSHSGSHDGDRDDPNAGEPILELPSPSIAGSVPPSIGDDKSQYEFTPSISEFTFGSIEVPSTPLGSNSLALSISSSSPRAKPMPNHSLGDRRPLNPINPDFDDESPFQEQGSPPYSFVGISNAIPPFVGLASARDSVDSPRSSRLSASQNFATESTDGDIRSARDDNSPDVPRFAVNDEPRSSENVDSSSMRAEDV